IFILNLHLYPTHIYVYHFNLLASRLSYKVHRPPPRSTLFPYTTLFRSLRRREHRDHRDRGLHRVRSSRRPRDGLDRGRGHRRGEDRKSTRLNSSHVSISYAVFCLKKKINIIDKKKYARIW